MTKPAEQVPYDAVVIGVSAGGLHALRAILPRLPEKFPVPVVVVQHRGAESDDFFAQYLADYNFLFQNSRGTWYNGGYGDYLYLLAYFLMSIGIIQLKTIHTQLSKG